MSTDEKSRLDPRAGPLTRAKEVCEMESTPEKIAPQADNVVPTPNGADKLITVEETAALDHDEALMSQLRVNLFSAAGLAASAIPLGVVKAHKPHELFRTHPDANAVPLVWSVFDEGQKGVDFYVAMPAMVEPLRALKAKIVLCKYYLTITADGIVRWLVVPQSENSWHVSREKCAVLARRSWGRMISNQEADQYDWFDPKEHGYEVSTPEPSWPPESPAKLFMLAFKDRGRLITDPEHALVRKLVGRSGVSA
jgi:hypothetical protein